MSELGKPTHFILHWTAGNYEQVFDDYHFCITYNPETKKANVVQTRSIHELGAHTWFRNHNAIGLSFCAMVDHNHNVQKDQLEVMSKLVAELCCVFDIDPNGVYDAPLYHNDGVTLHATGETFKAPVIADHCTYAEKDKYGPHGSKDRWDIGDPSGIIKWNGKVLDLLPIVKKKTVWYYDQLKNGKIHRQFTLHLK